ncbi:MAG: hypothetical protein L0H70_07880 [Xanthomonadales bacterium]|nr:hypothetical protein [Xanthomonadales bacterium]
MHILHVGYSGSVWWPKIKTATGVVLTPVHLRRTLLIAFVVGTWLNLFNHSDDFLQGAISLQLAGKVVLNYLTPFVVSNIGLLARTLK